MGEAKRRGTYEERKAQAIQREQDRLATIEAKRQVRLRQEIEAYSVMVWWQLEMSERRQDAIRRRMWERNVAVARIMSVPSGIGALRF